MAWTFPHLQHTCAHTRTHAHTYSACTHLGMRGTMAQVLPVVFCSRGPVRGMITSWLFKPPAEGPTQSTGVKAVAACTQSHMRTQELCRDISSVFA